MERLEHTSTHYEQLLRELKDRLLQMSHLAEQMISDHFLDDLHEQNFRELLTHMLEDPRSISRAIN